jgi:DUF2927 family protein
MPQGRLSATLSTAVATLSAAIAVGGVAAARAENSAISIRRATERTEFSNDEIKDGLFKTAFRAELQFGRHEERIRKFDEPVRVFVDNRGAATRTADIAAIVQDIRTRIARIDSPSHPIAEKRTSWSRWCRRAILRRPSVPATDLPQPRRYTIRSIPNVCRASPR